MANEDLEKQNLELTVLNHKLGSTLQTVKLKSFGLACQLDWLERRLSQPDNNSNKGEYIYQLERIIRELKDLMEE